MDIHGDFAVCVICAFLQCPQEGSFRQGRVEGAQGSWKAHVSCAPSGPMLGSPPAAPLPILALPPKSRPPSPSPFSMCSAPGRQHCGALAAAARAVLTPCYAHTGTVASVHPNSLGAQDSEVSGSASDLLRLNHLTSPKLRVLVLKWDPSPLPHPHPQAAPHPCTSERRTNS